VTPSGIEPSTFWLVAQCLNQRQVGYLPELYEDARSEKYLKFSLLFRKVPAVYVEDYNARIKLAYENNAVYEY
jgi:hypothetical protein